MTDSTEIYRGREIGSLPPATFDQLRDALFDPDLNGFSLDAANVQYTGRVAAAAAAGKLLEAGHIIPERLLEEPISSRSRAHGWPPCPAFGHADHFLRHGGRRRANSTDGR